MIFDPKIDPQTTQDRPKTDPRGSSKPSFFNVDFCIHFWCVLGSILDPFGEPFGPQNRSQIDPDFFLKLHCGNIPLRDRFKRPQELAKSPKRPPRDPQENPRGGQEGAKMPQDAPKRLQETPRATKDAARGPKSHLRGN